MSLPRYAEYKESSVAWLGEVPAHWQVTPVKRVANIVNGYPFDSNLFDSSTGMPLVRIRDLNKKTTEALYKGERIEAAVVTSADVLVGMDGDFNVGRWLGDGAALLNQRMCCVRGRSEVVSRLLEYALPTPLRLINDLTYSTTVKHLASSQIEKTRVALPQDESELEHVLAFLDRETGKIDALIAEQEKLLTLLAEKRQATISHAVTRGLNPNALMKDSGVPWLGDVPVHWHVLRLASVYREVAELGNDELPILSVSIHDGVSDKELDDAEMDRKVTRSDDRSKYKRVAPNDLTYNMMRAWQGGFGTVTVHGQVSPAYVVARPLGDIRTMFVEQLLRTPQAIEQVRRYSRGITEFRLRLYWEEFKNIRIAVPPVAEQDEILSAVTREIAEFNKLTGTVEHAIFLLKERRSALIAAAVTGKIDVRQAV